MSLILPWLVSIGSSENIALVWPHFEIKSFTCEYKTWTLGVSDRLNLVWTASKDCWNFLIWLQNFAHDCSFISLVFIWNNSYSLDSWAAAFNITTISLLPLGGMLIGNSETNKMKLVTSMIGVVESESDKPTGWRMWDLTELNDNSDYFGNMYSEINHSLPYSHF